MTSRRRMLYLHDLLRELIIRDLKIRYQRSMLGIAWSWLKPLSQLLVFLVVFGMFLPVSILHYASYVFTGVMAWSWFGNAVGAAATSITGNPELVRRPAFPIRILPVLVVLNEGIHFVLALPILLAVTIWQTGFPGPSLIALPLVMLIQFCFTLSLSYGVAASHVRFRDTQDAVGILVMVAFYLTPIFYQPTGLDKGYAAVLQFNPMTQVIGAYRAILMEHRWPAMGALLLVAAASAAIMAGCMWFFARQSETFVEEL